MPLTSFGDLASSVLLRRQNMQLNTDMARLAQELASGQVADVPRHLNGNYSYLGDIERNMRVLEGFDTAAKEASVFTGAMQSVLDKVQSTTNAFAPDLIMVGNSGLPEARESVSARAKGELGSLLAGLNTDIAGRSLFSGVETDSPSFASASTFLSELQLAVAGEVTLSGILSAVDTWFNTPGGGFETNGYLGSQTSLPPFLVGEGESVDLDLRGDTPVVRDLLKHTAIAALAADPGLGYSNTLQSALMVNAGEGLITAQDSLTGIRADLGYAEARVDESKSRISSEQTSLEIARNELLGADPYETAVRLENVQFQLESLYTATARLSQMSLVEYL